VQEMAWYFPCNLRSQNGSSPDLTNITSPYTCHTEPSAREQYSQLKASGEVYFDWKDIRDPSRNLAVYQGLARPLLS
jgi:chitin synthase